MRLKRHTGVPVKRGGIYVKEQDYDGKYAVVVQSTDGEEHTFLLDSEQMDRLNTLTEEPVGKYECDDGWLSRLKPWD